MSKHRPSVKAPYHPRLTIAFDASCLTTDAKTGVAHYTAGLITALASRHPEICFVGHYCNFLNRKQFTLPSAPNITYHPSHYLSARLLNMLRRLHMWLPFEFLVRQRADLHLFPAFIGWPSLFKTPSIAVIHDLAYLDIPESVSARNRADLMAFVPKTLHISRYALTVSDATAQRLRAVYGAGVPPTITTHIPLSPLPEISPAEITEVKTKYRIENDFILFVGTLEPRKNILGALEAYTELPAALRKTHSLVLAGAIGWNSNAIERRIAELQSQGYDIVQTGYVDTVSKVALYRSAAAFLLPSFYEGFGMPILEAMSYGLPCVVSDIPVFHEVAGTAAIFCNPHDSHDIARQLTRVLDNAATRTKYALLARQRSREYVSWDAIADLVYPVIADITEEK